MRNIANSFELATVENHQESRRFTNLIYVKGQITTLYIKK
jgi:hypothetical protein